jgi:NTP pyrophosphatase (non-canonical NTP hydrolase)
MEFNEYQEKALATMREFDNKKDQIINGLLGLASESGEVCDLMKKHFCLGNELDKDMLMKELGDVMWYMAEICDAYGFTMQDVAEKNIAKLRARHGEKFSGIGNRTGEGE